MYLFLAAKLKKRGKYIIKNRKNTICNFRKQKKKQGKDDSKKKKRT